MSTSDGIGRDHPVTPASQLADAVEAANTLLYHAMQMVVRGDLPR